MKQIIMLLSFSLLTCLVSAQPLVNPDNTVTFRVFAPKADSVKIEGDIIFEFTKQFDFKSNKTIPMTKGDDGVWSVTIGPLEPNPYLYTIQIDDRSMPDPNNFRIFTGQRYRKSILLVNTPDTSAVWEMRKVIHGTVHNHTYYSPTAKGLSELFVYTPPGYEQGDKKYPVLYLLHGRGEKADSWLNAGFVNQIADNLIAQNKANPMIIVMPFGWVIPPKTPDNQVVGLLFLGAGSQDNIGPGGSSIDGQRSLDSLLAAKGIKHTFYEMPDAGHTWYAWRYYLCEKFLPFLWK